MRLALFLGSLLIFLSGCALIAYSLFTPGFDPALVAGVLFVLGGMMLAACLGEG